MVRAWRSWRVAASSSLQPLCCTADWTCGRYGSSCVIPLYLGSLAGVLGSAAGCNRLGAGTRGLLAVVAAMGSRGSASVAGSRVALAVALVALGGGR